MKNIIPSFRDSLFSKNTDKSMLLKLVSHFAPTITKVL